MKKHCSFCGNTEADLDFKDGYVCDKCLRYIKTVYGEKKEKDDGLEVKEMPFKKASMERKEI